MAAHPVGIDATRLSAVLTRACEAGDAIACMDLARLVQSAPGLTLDKARVPALYARACKLGNAVACFNGIAVDGTDALALSRAAELLVTACSGGDGRSCAVLSAAAPVLFPGDPATPAAAFGRRAAEQLEQSCVSGVASDCMLAAQQIADSSPDRERLRTVRILERGCELGVAESCMLLGRLPERSVAERDVLLRRACDGDEERACFLLAAQEGARSSSDLAAKKSWFDRFRRLATARCALGQIESCKSLLHVLSIDGALTRAETNGTLALAAAVCNSGVGMICFHLARAMTNGPEGLRDGARGAQLVKQACELGYPPACQTRD